MQDVRRLHSSRLNDVLPATLPVGIKSPQANHRPNVIAQPIARPSNHPSSLSWRRLDSGDPPKLFSVQLSKLPTRGRGPRPVSFFLLPL